MPKIGFSSRTFGFIGKYSLNADVLNSVASEPLLRAEIRRVFQVANRRIQNIESKGDVISPALRALGKDNITGFTKFSMKGSWEDLKTEYSKAISFLHQPTSTLTGTKEYNEHLKSQYDLSDEEFSLMAEKLNDKLLSLRDSDFVEQYLMRYKDFTGEMEASVQDVSQQIESDAISLQKALEEEVLEAAYKQRSFDKEEARRMGLNDILRIFDEFGL